MTGDVRQLLVALDDREDPARLRVTGDIDIDTAEEFERAVAAAAGRVPPVVVDLTDVSFLGSVGIHVLMARLTRLHSVEVRAGTVVARSLTLVGCPKLTIVPGR